MKQALAILLALPIAIVAIALAMRASDAMQLQGQQPVTVGSFPVVSASIVFDLAAHTYTITYGQPPNMVKTISGSIPGALQTAIENHVQARIEAAENWEAGSSVVTP